MVLSNCWGLLLIIIFLGYGVVSVPRSFWDSGNNSRRLRFLYIKAANLDDDINNAAENLNETVKKIYMSRDRLPNKTMLEDDLEKIIDLCPQSLKDRHESKKHKNDLSIGLVTKETLVRLHKEIKNALASYKITKYELNEVILQTIFLEDILVAKDSPFKRIAFTIKSEERKCMARTIEILEWYWYLTIKPLLCKIVSMLLWNMSILIILGESTLFIGFPVGVFPLMFQQDYGIIISQLLCLIPLIYIVICTYYGIFQLKLPGWYGLYPKNTEASSLIYCAYYLARLSAPLAFNFFLFIKVKNSVFEETMGIVDLVTRVGNHFAVFFPLLLVLFSFLNYIHAYGRVLRLLGINQVSFVDDSQEQRVNEGKNILKRERNLLLKSSASGDKYYDWEMMNLDIMKETSSYSPKRLLS